MHIQYLLVFNIDVTIEKSIETLWKLQFCALCISVKQLQQPTLHRQALQVQNIQTCIIKQ